MTLQWVSVDALTGRLLNDLPGLSVDWPIRRTIGKYETATAHLALKGAPPEWERATLPYGAVLACYDDTDTARSIQWAGPITRRSRRGGKGVVDLSVSTGEAYFDRRIIGVDVAYMATGQNVIVRNLIQTFVADTGGMPFAVQFTTAGNGAVRDQAYKGVDFAKVYRRLQELMALDGGPEWTVEWAWSGDGVHLVPTLMVGDRIGTASPAGLDPDAQFNMPGCLTDIQLIEDYGDGNGATRVTAYSSGQGSTTPTSGPRNAANTQGRPVIEYAFTPAASVTDQVTLDSYALKTVAQLAPGQNAVTLTADLETAPRLGRAWFVGDDIRYAAEKSLTFPLGFDGRGRTVAYELTINTISPILAQPGTNVEAQ